jgi:hypothetical protein
MPPKTAEQLESDWRKMGSPQAMAAKLAIPKATGVSAQPSQVEGTLPDAAPTAPVQTEPAATIGPTGFVSFSTELAANQDAANRMAQQAAGQALGARQVGMLGTQEGRQALLQRAYGKAAQLSDFDAALAGAAGGNEFQQLERMYGPAGQAQDAERAAYYARQQQAINQQGAAMQQRQAALTAKPQSLTSQAQNIRAADALRGTGQMTREQWANMHGMTLEQWIQNGKRPAY